MMFGGQDPEGHVRGNRCIGPLSAIQIDRIKGRHILIGLTPCAARGRTNSEMNKHVEPKIRERALPVMHKKFKYESLPKQQPTVKLRVQNQPDQHAYN